MISKQHLDRAMNEVFDDSKSSETFLYKRGINLDDVIDHVEQEVPTYPDPKSYWLTGFATGIVLTENRLRKKINIAFFCCSLALTILGFLVGVTVAEARVPADNKAVVSVTDARAKVIADWWSAKWCPHHFGGVCLRRRSHVSRYYVGTRPLGHNIRIEGWESLIIDPTRDWRKARWYYKRCGYLTMNGRWIKNARWC